MEAVSITEPRVKFIKGWLTGGGDPGDGSVECGNGTEYPLEVTREQLEEIMYRVRDSEFVDGEVKILFSDGDPENDNNNLSTFTFGAPPSALYASASADFLLRGYHTAVLIFDPSDPDPMPNYGLAYFDESYVINDGLNDIKVREAVEEKALWAAVEDPPGTLVVGMYQQFNGDASNTYFLQQPSDTQFRTGFSYFGQDGAATTIAGYPIGFSDFFFAGGSTAYVNFSGQVAWIDVDSSGNPFSPNNRIFIGMIFAQGNDPVLISTNKTAEIGSTFGTNLIADIPLGIDFELELANSIVVSCPLYYGVLYDTSPYSASVASVTNYRLKATKWFPYAAKNGSPAWNAATGAPINVAK